MNIRIDYDDHPDLGGQQQIFDVETMRVVKPEFLKGKIITSIALKQDILLVGIEDNKLVDELLAKNEELSSNLLNSEQDLERLQAILAGEWPDSITILEKALIAARKIAQVKQT